MKRHMASSVGFCVFVAFLSPSHASAVPTTGPADLGLSSQAPSPIVRGATVPVYAYVYNVAPAGSADLNYSLYYTLPDNSVTATVNGTKAADGGATPKAYQYDFDSTSAPFGDNTFVIHASDPNALDSPQAQQVTVRVVHHAVPAMWVQGQEISMQESTVQEPEFTPEAFGATGGGEFFSAAAPHILNDPAVATAGMDLDSISSTGDPQITTNLGTTTNVTANDDPTAGIAWTIFVDGSTVGHYSKILTLLFSDQDIPGADATGSVEARILIQADVTSDGVTGSLEILPEPRIAIALMPILLICRGAGGIKCRIHSS